MRSCGACGRGRVSGTIGGTCSLGRVSGTIRGACNLGRVLGARGSEGGGKLVLGTPRGARGLGRLLGTMGSGMDWELAGALGGGGILARVWDTVDDRGTEEDVVDVNGGG